MRKIKILFLASRFVMGGIEKSNIAMINNINKEKFDVHVVCFEGGILMDELNIEDITLLKIGEELRLKSFRNFLYILKVFKYIKINEIEVIHTIDSICYLIGASAAKLSKIKHIRTQPNFIRRHEKLNTRTLRILPFESWTHKYITYQYASAEDLNLAGVDKNKIETIRDFTKIEDFLYYDPISDIREEFSIPRENKIILAMHRMVENKGYEIFIDTIPYIIEQYSKVTFLLVGDGPLRNTLRERVLELGLEDYVVFTGFRKDTANIIKQIEFGIYPLADTAAMVPVINGGKVLITKKNSSMDEYIVDGVTGILVSEDKPESYAQAALELLLDKEKLRFMEDKQKVFVEKNFNGSKNIEKLEMIIESLCDLN